MHCICIKCLVRGLVIVHYNFEGFQTGNSGMTLLDEELQVAGQRMLVQMTTTALVRM